MHTSVHKRCKHARAQQNKQVFLLLLINPPQNTKSSNYCYHIHLCRGCPRLLLSYFRYSGVNILHYSQIKYLGKVSIFWCFREEFLHFDEKFQLYLRILMKITNYLVDYMVYASLLGKSLFLAFGKGFLGFCKIFTPVARTTKDMDKIIRKYQLGFP